MQIPNTRTDWLGLLDEFAPRFYGELDYVLEGQNGERFVEIMKDIKQVCHQGDDGAVSPKCMSMKDFLS